MEIPSEARLTKEEHFTLHEKFFGKGSGSCCELDDTDLCFRVADAQLKKAAPIIEAQAYQKGFDAGLKATMDAADSTFGARLKQAKREERERIVKYLEGRHDPRSNLYDRLKALKGEK